MLLSEGSMAERLRREIAYLADAYGGPVFPPHVTLVGAVTGSEADVVQSATELAASLKVCSFQHVMLQVPVRSGLHADHTLASDGRTI